MTRFAWLSWMAFPLALGGFVAALSARAAVEPQTSQSVPSTPERLAEMPHHFTQVSRIQEAITRGDLPAVRGPAAQLTKVAVPSGVPASAAAYVVAIRQGAQRAADATTLAGAAQATAAMVTECGNCHQAVGIFPAPAVRQTPDVGGLVGHMLEHKRASDELLKGLVIPSASYWRQGAERLRVAALRPTQLPFDSKLTGDIRKAEDHIHKLADQAVGAESTAERTALYVQLLTTCAECHGLHRQVWGPRAGR
jgi:mono/diheme cytochrome c family protein